MVTVREGTEEDIRYVYDRLWYRGMREIQNFGHADIAGAAKIFLSLPAEHRYAFCVNTKPVAVFGAVPSANTHGSVYSTWFLATDKFPKVARQATRILKRLIEQKTVEENVKILKLISASDHPKAAKWFTMLGFRLTKQQGALQFYEYEIPPVDFDTIRRHYKRQF